MTSTAGVPGRHFNGNIVHNGNPVLYFTEPQTWVKFYPLVVGNMS